MRRLVSLLTLVLSACSGNFECPGDSVGDDGLGCVCPPDAFGHRQELARDGDGELLLRSDAPFCRPLCERGEDDRERVPNLVGGTRPDNGTTGEYERDAGGRPLCGARVCLEGQSFALQRPEENVDGLFAWLCVDLTP